MIVHRVADADLASADFVRSRSPLPDGTDPPFGTRLVTLRPSEETRPHDHHDVELWVILDGDGEVAEDGDQRRVAAGDVVVLPPLGRHSLRNLSGDAPLSFLTVYWASSGALAEGHASFGSRGGESPLLVLPSFPTPNGDLHLGHLAGPYVAADVCARAVRASGRDARLLLGTVGHQSQVAVAARAAGKSFLEVAEQHTGEVLATLGAAGVTHDVFVPPGAASTYERFARATFDHVVSTGAAVRERRPGWRCPDCERWLVEAFVTGRCPRCGSAETAGIECEVCALPYEEAELVDAACAACGIAAEPGSCERWWLPLEPLRPQLEHYLARVRMPARLRRYAEAVMAQDLVPLPVSVPVDHGVDVGDAGIEGQRLYSAFELAARFLTAVDVVAREDGHDSVESYAAARAPRTVALFGWDNAYLRTVAFPAVLLASGASVDPPEAMVCNEFYELGSAKFSTGRRHAIWGRDLAGGGLRADPLRLHLAATRPEGRRTSFTLERYQGTLAEVEAEWCAWLEDTSRRLGLRFEGEVPEAGSWDAEHVHFFADIAQLHREIALAYEPATLSLRRAASALRGFVARAAEFAVSQQPDGHPEVGVHRTGMALEMMALRSFGLAARPLLPAMAEPVLAALGASDEKFEVVPSFVTPGHEADLEPAVVAWREAVAGAGAMVEALRERPVSAGGLSGPGSDAVPAGPEAAGAVPRDPAAERQALPVWMVGFNSGIAEALGPLLEPGSIDLLEERALWDAKGLAEKLPRYEAMGEARFAAYQQHRGFLATARDLGRERLPAAVLAGLEYAAPAAAEIAELLGVRGAGVEAARTLCDKLLLRERTEAAGMRVPRWRQVCRAEDVRQFAGEVGAAGIVLKPAQRQASLGVLLLSPDDDIEAAWSECVGADEPKQLADRDLCWRYLVEERLYGEEFSSECVVEEGRIRFLNVTRKRTLPGRHPVELGHTVPGAEAGPGSPWWSATDELASAVGFSTGILHAEWILTDDGPVLIECAGRPPGDRILELVDLAYGMNTLWYLVRTLAGQPVEEPPSPSRFAAIEFLVAGPGCIRAVRGTDEARNLDGVQRVDLMKQPGDRVTGTASSWDRVASALAVGETAEQAQGRAAAALAAIDVDLG